MTRENGRRGREKKKAHFETCLFSQNMFAVGRGGGVILARGRGKEKRRQSSN